MTIQQYLLQCLQEEAAEIICAASKCQRFGPHEVWDDLKSNPQALTNWARLDRELYDLLAIVHLLRSGPQPDTLCLMSELMIPYTNSKIADKLKRVEKYMRYSEKLGIVE